MKFSEIKKIISILLILVGAATLMVEIASKNKNYYLQSAGLVLLMIGLFVVNSKVKSKVEVDLQEYFEEE